jgi:hypothetical protein
MGFNKRFLKKEGILLNLENIMDYLDADAVYLTDEFSRDVYRMFNSAKTKEEIINFIEEFKNDTFKF